MCSDLISCSVILGLKWQRAKWCLIDAKIARGALNVQSVMTVLTVKSAINVRGVLTLRIWFPAMTASNVWIVQAATGATMSKTLESAMGAVARKIATGAYSASLVLIVTAAKDAYPVI